MYQENHSFDNIEFYIIMENCSTNNVENVFNRLLFFYILLFKAKPTTTPATTSPTTTVTTIGMLNYFNCFIG